MTNDFKKQYEHPLWQKKRLEALENAGWGCEYCGNEEKELHVHHKAYRKNRKIWEYELDELSVLCSECHSITHRDWAEIDDLCRKMKIAEVDVVALIGYMYATIIDQTTKEGDAIMNTCMLEGICQYFSIPMSFAYKNNLQKLSEFRLAYRELELGR